MKRIITLLMIFLIGILSACSSNLNNLSESDIIQKESKMILDAFNNHDKDKLINLFSLNVKESAEFDIKIEQMLDLYKCDEYISSKIPNSASGGKSWDSRGVNEWNIQLEIFCIHTISNDELSMEYGYDRFYSIDYDYTIVNKDIPQLEGINYLKLTLLNREYIEIYNEEDRTL